MGRDRSQYRCRQCPHRPLLSECTVHRRGSKSKSPTTPSTLTAGSLTPATSLTPTANSVAANEPTLPVPGNSAEVHHPLSIENAPPLQSLHPNVLAMLLPFLQNGGNIGSSLVNYHNYPLPSMPPQPPQATTTVDTQYPIDPALVNYQSVLPQSTPPSTQTQAQSVLSPLFTNDLGLPSELPSEHDVPCSGEIVANSELLRAPPLPTHTPAPSLSSTPFLPPDSDPSIAADNVSHGGDEARSPLVLRKRQSSEPRTSQLPQTKRIRPSQANPVHGTVEGAMVGSKEYVIARTRPLRPLLDDASDASRRFNREMVYIISRAERLCRETGAWMILGMHHAHGTLPITYTSPRMRKDADEESKSLTAQFIRLMQVLKKARFKDAKSEAALLLESQERAAQLEKDAERQALEYQQSLARHAAELAAKDALIRKYKEGLNMN